MTPEQENDMRERYARDEGIRWGIILGMVIGVALWEAFGTVFGFC